MSVAPPGLARFLSVIRGQHARCAKRVAPGTFEKRSTGLEGRQKRVRVSVAPPGLARFLFVIQGQRARCRSHLPLATIYRACGASEPGSIEIFVSSIKPDNTSHHVQMAAQGPVLCSHLQRPRELLCFESGRGCAGAGQTRSMLSIGQVAS
jgi:hypothetical protein